MSESLSSAIDKAVRRFLDMCGDSVENVVITRPDGLIVYAYTPPGAKYDARSIAALISLLMGSSKRIYNQLRGGDIDTIMIDGKRGKILVKYIDVGGTGVYVSVITPSDNPEPNIGLIMLALDNLGNRLREILKGY
ncbi:MAG: hypothetical protein GXO10_01530 [Crenarchaeota archaeon]|nr:hypothetical protein [Thermoproteota archaeon]